MKTLKIAIIIGIISISSFAGAYAFKVLPITNAVKIDNDQLSVEGINIQKFIDGDKTCYVSYIKSFNNKTETVSSSISCVK